ncbi:thrombomodulin [Acanthochromis polyacanthus]|uniref:thrombomodulin n=1 Tax=Acanthochromis polyacanthus TaxID=80966 RepID=UPI000B900366|nr:thrombomodulin [Acanthochromis polyacanthus]
MACLQLRVFVPVKLMKRSFLMSAMFLLCLKTGFGMKQAGTCRPVCIGSDCITVNLDRVDFKTAEEACQHSNGEFLTLQSETDMHIFGILSQELLGGFWIGLRLPAGACSNLSDPLRGYEWTSDNVDRSFIPSFNTWKDSVKLCSPHCVSLSNDQKWTERLCSDKTDGFLCKAKHKDACQAQEVSDPVVFQDPKGCFNGPCEHTCNAVKGGYTCSCFSGYIPDSLDPTRCKMLLYCAQEKCPAICESESCYCPEGFLRSDQICEDINECEMNECDHECKNTFGSFVCSCRKGYVLKDQGKCIKAKNSEHLVVTTPVAVGFVKPAANNTLKGSSDFTGRFLWIWIVVAVAVLAGIFVIRFHVVKRQRSREQNSTQQSAVIAPMDNIGC